MTFCKGTESVKFTMELKEQREKPRTLGCRFRPKVDDSGTLPCCPIGRPLTCADGGTADHQSAPIVNVRIQRLGGSGVELRHPAVSDTAPCREGRA